MNDLVRRWAGLAGAMLCVLAARRTMTLPELRVRNGDALLIGVMENHLRDHGQGPGPFFYVLFHDHGPLLVSIGFAVAATAGVSARWSRWIGAVWLVLTALLTVLAVLIFEPQPLEIQYFGYWDASADLLLWTAALLLVMAVTLASGRHLAHDVLAVLVLVAVGSGHLLMLALSPTFLAEDGVLRVEVHPQAWLTGLLLLGAAGFTIVVAHASARLRKRRREREPVETPTGV